MKYFIRLIFLVPLITCKGFSQDSGHFKMNAESNVTMDSLDTGGWLMKTTNSRFDFAFVDAEPNREFYQILLLQTIETLNYSYEDGPRSQMQLTAWRSVKGRYDKKLWTLSNYADEGEIWFGFYKTTFTHPHGDEDAYSLYRLDSGKLLVTYTSEPLMIGENTSQDRRVLCYQSRAGLMHLPSENLEAIGILTLCSKTQQIDRVMLISKDEHKQRTPDILLFSTRFPSGIRSNYELLFTNSVSGFTIQLTFSDSSIVAVPVKNDLFDLTRVTLAPDVRIQHVAP